MIDPAAPVHRPAATEYCFAEGGHLTERWNAPADEAVSVARAWVEPSVTPRWHRRPNPTERSLILEERGRVEGGDGPPEAVGLNDGVPVPSGVRPPIANTGDADLIFLATGPLRFAGTGQRRFSRRRAPVSNRRCWR